MEDEVTKIHQILAVETGVRQKTNRELTDAYHRIQRQPLITGIARTYRPKDEDGDQLPSETQLVQVQVERVLPTIADNLARLFDVVATKDASNAEARADVVVDGRTILSLVPVTTLLFLEKQLTDLRTVLNALPRLDPAEHWTFDETTGVYRSDVAETTKTKKVPRNHVKAEATDKHAAQVEMYHEDIVVGYWATTKFSGALPASRIATLVDRTDRLLEAVRVAREEANGSEVVDLKIGKDIFDFILEEV
jgi:hypothetical protein